MLVVDRSGDFDAHLSHLAFPALSSLVRFHGTARQMGGASCGGGGGKVDRKGDTIRAAIEECSGQTTCCARARK